MRITERGACCILTLFATCDKLSHANASEQHEISNRKRLGLNTTLNITSHCASSLTNSLCALLTFKLG